MRSNILPTPSLSRTHQIRRADIISAAITVINGDGYAAASVDHIAKQAGTSKGTVLYHFKSKREVEKAVVDTLYEAGATYIVPRITTANTHRERVTAYISSNLHFIAEHKEQVAAVQHIAKNTPLTDRGEMAIRSLEQLLKKGMQDGELKEFDPYTLAVAIRLIIDGSSFYMLEHPALDIDRYIHEIVQLFDKTLK
ncbi:MAG TPA: TetR/AcrR family transcriptional regulator [Candidatus Saccharimonadales bacterium]|nr:TetR/AcrR family transcriptional regulator [Candidatus Saccharimonadales bacterium]